MENYKIHTLSIIYFLNKYDEPYLRNFIKFNLIAVDAESMHLYTLTRCFSVPSYRTAVCMLTDHYTLVAKRLYY